MCNEILATKYKNSAILRRRILSAVNAITQITVVDSNKIAAIGYCFGGVCAIELARSGSDILGVISVHGILSPAIGLSNKKITTKVLCLHGFDDPMVPLEQVQAFQTEMTDSSVDWQLHSYGNTMHAFSNPNANNLGAGVQFNALADHRASQTIKSFLEELF